jgi:mono/diheme cytochrome c family protein
MWSPRGLTIWKTIVLMSLLGLWPCRAVAQPAAPAAEDDELQTGLIGSYRDRAGHTLRRVDPQLALQWQQTPPDRRLSTGPYAVHWNGFLMSQARGAYRLSVYAAGKVRVSLGGQVVIEGETGSPGWMHSEPIELAFDWHPLEVGYTSLSESGRVNLFWSGPGFSLEPVSPRQLFHEPADAPVSQFARGEQLVRGLRCAACHTIPGEAQPMAAPSLVHLKGQIEPQWLVEWLTTASEADSPPAQSEPQAMRRMPHFPLGADQARAIAAYLLAESQAAETAREASDKPAKGKRPDSQVGRRLVSSRGCLACHRLGALGRSELFGGGDLTSIGSKRPASFFRPWLLDPQSLNADHRMPTYEFNEEELGHITTFLQSLDADPAQARFDPQSVHDAQLVARGKELARKHQCAACHAMPAIEPEAEPSRGGKLAANSAWENACTAGNSRDDRPHFELQQEDRQAIEEFVRQLAPQPEPLPVTGEQLLVERNCLSCHQREGRFGLAGVLADVGASDGKLLSLLPALQPPTLTSVGDKLTDAALHDAIARRGEAHRPWLEVTMPRFRLSQAQEQALVEHLIAADRIPAGHGLAVAATAPESEEVLRLAGKRLVTSAGFGCTSCHAVGEVQPPEGPLDAKGPDLLMLSRRIRRPWFDRWVRNPARIVPRMEMPSVQLATPGVLHDNLDAQLAAVWEVLNLPDFRPPEPGPVRVVRRSNIAERDERSAVLTDVIKVGEREYIKPLVIGLPNRHNLLFDLEQARLSAWWIGDTAQQRTKGKTWFWTAGGEDLLAARNGPGLFLTRNKGDRKQIEPLREGQFASSLDHWKHGPKGEVKFTYRLRFALAGEDEPATVTVEETIQPMDHGIRRSREIRGIPPGYSLWHHIPTPRTDEVTVSEQQSGSATIQGEEIPPEQLARQAHVHLFKSSIPADRFPQEIPPMVVPEPASLASVPGFAATRLSLPTDVMPTALAWNAEGDIYLTSLKGRVWHGRRDSAEGHRFQWRVFSDELAAPFGIAVGTDYVDVLNKYALLRLTDKDRDGFAETTRVLAAGWGHTADYHDWAVGLEQDPQGNYYVAIPCEQDGRSLAAAHWRGKVLRIDPLRGKIQEISGGHRFPIGIARNRQGELFVSDNQGNYNPFNELNHVQLGKRYGFLNSTEKKRQDFDPELTPPAIDIPHPWTRSVNGICFLETPEALRKQGTGDLFGPFEGHLVGCEYDTRRLIRLSLDRVGDTIQGAAYPLSIVPRENDGETFLGPISCAVSPAGELFIGNIRDSGWGGGNNIGSLVSMRFDESSLPVGIREVRAEAGGLRIEFTAPLEAGRLADADNYAISSYTRVSTLAYGGDDQNRRREAVRKIEVNEDRTSVLLRLKQLRAGYVYEIKLSSLVENDEAFHPAEAYYTMRQVPQ